jgi:hypothetical protein
MSRQVRTFATCMFGNAIRAAFHQGPVTCIVVLLLAASYAMAATTVEWRVGIVDTAGGSFSSMKFDKDGNGHVSYLDPVENQLRYGFWDHVLRKWFTTTVDRSAGFCSLTLDSHQRPHISHMDYGGGLKYAYWDGVTWHTEKISIAARDIEFYTSIALDHNDLPSISFYEPIAADGSLLVRLRCARWNGKYWAVTTVDTDKGSGKFNSIAIDSKGNPRIAYGNVNYENASLRYSYWTGESWKTDIVEGEGKPGTSCWSVAMVLDKDDNPHITYTNVPELLVKYATKKDGHWKIEAVDSLARQGYPDRNAITLDDHGNPYLSYYDAGAGVVKLAYREGQKWFSEVIDRGFSGYESAVAIYHGVIWLTYADETGGTLKFARRPLGETEAANREK